MAKEGMAVKKITGGKLVRVDVRYSRDRIEHVKITGDFFLQPDELLEAMEDRLVGLSLPLAGARVAEDLQKLLDEQEAVLVGFTPLDLVEILAEALK